jgi:hypothetical protein
MKRILLLATVAALMAVMLAVSAVPGLAHNVWCTGNWVPAFTNPGTGSDADGDGRICTKTAQQGLKGILKDDHGFGGH